MEPQNAALRERSGNVDAADPLVDFFYHLLRDHLPAGEVEGIMQKHVFVNGDGWGKSQFCNGYLANYAKDLAARMRRRPEADDTFLDSVKRLIFSAARTQTEAETMLEHMRSSTWMIPEMRINLPGVGFIVLRDVNMSVSGKILAYAEGTVVEDPARRRF